MFAERIPVEESIQQSTEEQTDLEESIPSSTSESIAGITEQEIDQRKAEDAKKIEEIRREFGLSKEESIETVLKGILNKEQAEILELDVNLSNLVLSEEGKLGGIEQIQDREDAQMWREKVGILDARVVEGALVIIYNANEKLPEGCPDLRLASHNGMPRSGEYHPDSKICFVDLSDSWSFLEDRYIPSFVEQFVRHELRHHLVSREDERLSKSLGLPERRNIDWEQLLKENPSKARELAYLDELHSQYFDALDGAREGRECFQNIDSRFYTVAGVGPHKEIGTETEIGKEAVENLFYQLQTMLLHKKMSESNPEMQEKIQNIITAFGVLLATERSVSEVVEKGSKLVELISTDDIQGSFKDFLKEYKFNAQENMPEMSDNLKKRLTGVPNA